MLSGSFKHNVISKLLILIFCAISLSAYAEQHDFSQIKASKTLRVIVWQGAESYMPRAGSPPNVELEYMQQFADENKLAHLRLPRGVLYPLGRHYVQLVASLCG